MEMEHKLFLQLLSDFLDDELDVDLADDFERELENEICCHFFNTFKKTVEMCRQIEMIPVPRTLHYKIIKTIGHTHTRTTAKKRKNKKKSKPSRKQLAFR